MISRRFKYRGFPKIFRNFPKSQFIKDVNEHGYGGVEYLYSVPGLVGGAICMNAGRGRKYNQSISDHLISVRAMCAGEVQELTKEECAFSYRHSVFQEQPMIVVSATFRFPEMAQDETKKLCEERIAVVKKTQDNRYPNAGTTFCEADPYIMKLFMKLSSNKTQGCHFSNEYPNWLQNRGQGTFDEAFSLLKKVEFLHRTLRKECRREIKLICHEVNYSL